ncbi:MAG: hypothetical protein CMJ19_14415 [Phycisphaeraceae bacterium]|nr:hypothetical protein [Phycisphaeraceae bacterium]
MPSLNWDIFTNLPGSAEKNFELLCRGIVRQNFGSYGTFRALANQPGVEFHLKLDSRSDTLGNPGRWWGWQCKWYDLAENRKLGLTRRKKIEDGLRKTEQYLPDLTDWVLWTRRTLTKDDQDWFNGLSSKMTLHMWTGDEVDSLLAGQAVVLRGTYFGELVLTPNILHECHKQAVAPIKARWQPDVHHVCEAESDLRCMLGEVEVRKNLSDLAIELRMSASAINSSPTVPVSLEPLVTGVVATTLQLADTLDRIVASIGVGDLDLLRDEFAVVLRSLHSDVVTAPRKLRARRQRAGLYATNAVAGCHDAIRLIGEVEAGFSSRMVTVLAPAGCGKTHLAAQLTAGTTERPNGVLLHGRDLHASHTLDDLARRVLIAAQPVASMEALLAAVDAAGQRAQKRLPIIIDGLNESEDPRTWKSLLATIETTLAKYPYVLLVCTLRPEFVDEALPKDTHCLEINDYGEEAIEAVRKHFDYWKIDATDVPLPGFLRHPLTLRLFCEVTNPSRQQVVGIGATPGSLSELFDRFLKQVGERVVELAPRTQRFYAQDVNNAITAIANKLWESKANHIELSELRNMLADTHRPWDQSLVRALEHEGVLLRMPSNGTHTYVPVYDLLGGHIIANALLAKHGQSSFEVWIKDSSTTTLLAGSSDVRHPLADDILHSLVGQVPRRSYAKQVWQLVDEPLRDRALRMSAYHDPAYLDVATVDALLDLVRAGDSEMLFRFWQIRGTQGHPLNAEGLDRALREMTVSERDLRWTEWIRRNKDDLFSRRRSVLSDLEHLEQRWKDESVRGGDGEQLRARWVMWTLTSTVRRLRDQATHTLYWFGRADHEGLFTLTIDSLQVNDAYVSERMLAAAYGVVMSHQQVDAGFADSLEQFLEQLSSALIGHSATAPTHHYLSRLYVRGIVSFAAKFYPTLLPTSLRGTWMFAAPQPVQPLANGDADADEAGRTLHMDFANYTLGSLFDDRSNYDMVHGGYQAAMAHVRGVVWALGWRASTFDLLDRSIADSGFRGGRGDRPLAERYGKKYGWIGFFTYAGLLEDQGQLSCENSEFSDVDIDPSFPEKPPTDGAVLVPEVWLSPTVESHETWMLKSTTSVPHSLLRREQIGDVCGPWVSVHGYVKAEDRILGREVWASISAYVTPKACVSRLVTALNAGRQPWVARRIPSDHYTFAGEIPWHSNFGSLSLTEEAYLKSVGNVSDAVEVEVLAHGFEWESYHSEMNQSGSTIVPSQSFSHRFDLYSSAQSFDQFLADGSRATITLSGVDGLEGPMLYIREDLLKQYVGDRAIIWYAFGEREIRPYPPSPPSWLVDAQQQDANFWHEVLTEADLLQNEKPSRNKKAVKRRQVKKNTAIKHSPKRVKRAKRKP